jgi:hypothetical protein
MSGPWPDIVVHRAPKLLAGDYPIPDWLTLVARLQQGCREVEDKVREREQRLAAEEQAARPKFGC